LKPDTAISYKKDTKQRDATMSFLTDEEINALIIKRMIFHVVGGELEIPVLLSEISPPEHVDFSRAY
jgi:hypothetical protein